MRAGTGVLRGLCGPRTVRDMEFTGDLAALALPVGNDGVVVGEDFEGRARLVALHRPEPYDVLLIGGLWTAQVLVLRAVGTGARVAVETGRVQAWDSLAGAVGPEYLTFHEVGRVPASGATADRPVLVVRDCGMRPPRGRVTASAWHSVVTLLPYVSPVAPRLMRGSALVGVQRASPEETERVGAVLGLTRAEQEALPAVADGVTLWCAGGDRHWVVTRPTDVESGLLGTPRRMD